MVDESFFDGWDDDDIQRAIKLIDIKNTRIEFVQKHHVNSSGDRLEFTRFRHMIDLYNTVAAKIVIVGAAQIGKTDWLVIDTLAAAYNNVPVFFVLPKYDMRNSYVTTRVQKPIGLSPGYKALNKGAISDSHQMLQFGPAFIKFVGSNVPSDFVSFSAGQYVIDEVDQCDSEENIDLGYSRMKGSIFRFERFVSNPTTKAGRIWREYQKSDQRVWKCPCTSCGKFSELDWFKSVVKEVEDSQGNVVAHVLRDTEWTPGIGRDIHIKCPEDGCDGNIDRFHEGCFWEPQNPDSGIEGYHMGSLVSPLNSVASGWMDYQEGLQNPSKMASFYSMFLALPYAPVGSKVSVNLLQHCTTEKEKYSVKIHLDGASVPEEVHPGPCSMGIDTSPNHIDVRISCNYRGKRKLVAVHKIDAKSQGRQAVEDRLHLLGETYGVECAVIDIGPEKLLAMDFQKNANFPVWLCKFLGRGEERKQKFNHVDMILSVDRTEALDRAYAQLKTRKNYLPDNYLSILDGAYPKEMTALVREVTEDKDGKLRYTWTSGNDHSFLADTYDLLAFDIISQDVLTGEQSVFVA